MRVHFGIFVLAGLASGCADPANSRAPYIYAEDLRHIYTWDPVAGARGHFAFDVMLSADPTVTVPILIGKLSDMTPTAIQDRFHDPVPVGNVAFHILCRIFGMRPEAFDREGVWVMQGEPTRNPIYMVRLDNAQVRAHLAARFRKLAIQREWIIPE